MIKRLFYASLKLSTHQNSESKSSLYVLAIFYPLLLQWYKTLSEETLRKFLDYTFLLEVSIKGIVLTFTDDKAKRYEINKRLGRIGITAAAAFRKITSRAKEQLEKKCQKNPLVVKSIKIMAVGHLIIYDHKLQQAVGGKQSKKLESEIEEWIRTCKNIEKHNSTTQHSLAKVFSSRCFAYRLPNKSPQ